MTWNMKRLGLAVGLAATIAATIAAPARAEWEMMFGCPLGARQMFFDMPQGMEYVGFRFVRRDGSTCNIFGASNQVLFAESDTQQLVVKGSEPPVSSAKVRLTSKEYKIRRRFYRQELGHYEYRNDGTQYWVSDGYDYVYSDKKEYTGESESASVEVTLEDRDTHPVLPWETEVFSFTMTGESVKAAVVNGAYKYTLKTLLEDVDDHLLAKVSLTPGEKLRTPIDQNAITGALHHSADGHSLAITFNDKWAAHYQGEPVEIEIEVRKNVRFRPDQRLFKGTVTYASAPTIVQDVMELPLNGILKKGQQYFVKFRFHRPGSRLSTDEWSRILEPARVVFNPRSAAVAEAEAEGDEEPVLTAYAGPELLEEQSTGDDAEPFQQAGEEVEITAE